MKDYNGKIQSVRRRYDSLKNFIGKNEIHKAGDVLCVSVKNDGDYSLFIHADGVHTFLELYLQQKNGGGASGTVPVQTNNDGKLNTFEEIIAFLEGMPEGSNLQNVLEKIDTSGLTDEERETIEQLVNSGEASEQDISDNWEEAMRQAQADAEGKE